MTKYQIVKLFIQGSWLTFILLTVAILSRFLFHGSVFDFDYGLYQPDGAHYTFRTLLFLGHNENDAARTVVNWYHKYSVDTQHLKTTDLLPGTNPLWNLSVPRVVYPALSMIPVYFLGIPGMLVIPVLSLAILAFSIQYVAKKLNQQNFGLLIIFLMLASPTVMRWMIANCTDSLLVGLIAMNLVVHMSDLSLRKKYLAKFVLIILSSFTRFCLPIWIAIFTIEYFISRNRGRSLSLIAISIMASLPAVLLQPGGDSALLPERNGQGLLNKLLYLPISFIKVAFIEAAQLAVLDRLLLLLLLVGIFFAFRNIRKEESLFFVAIALAVWAIGALNGVMGVNFRYQLPILPYLAWVLLKNLPELSVPKRIKK
jgi:hypothetical protein